MKAIYALACALLLLGQPVFVQSGSQTVLPWRSLPDGRKQTQIQVGSTQVQVDLALTPAERHLGLGYRNSLEPNTGMLFVFEDSAVRDFYMKGMRFCLDIIWIENGQIMGAAENTCKNPDNSLDPFGPTVSSGVPVTYVLEMPAGWLDQNGYGVGTPVDLTSLRD